MRINQIINDFNIFTTGEEKDLLKSFEGIRSINSFDEREQVVIENLVRKSLISKVRTKHGVWVRKNEI